MACFADRAPRRHNLPTASVLDLVSAGFFLQQLVDLEGQMWELIVAWETICSNRDDDTAFGSEDVHNSLTEGLALVEPDDSDIGQCLP